MTEPKPKFNPECRYGHGALGRIRLIPHSDQPRGMVIPTFRETLDMGPIWMDGNGYTVVMYRCSECGYLELFDDEVLNG